MKWSLITVVMCLLCSSIAGDADGWPMFQHDPQHSGYSSSPMPESLRNVWTNDNSVDVGLWLTIAEDNIFVSRYFSLDALDINTGSLLKSYRKPVRGFSFPAVENNKVYLNANCGIFCLDIDTGEELWRHCEPLLNVRSYPIAVGGHVFIGGGDPSDPTEPTPEGKEAWRLAMRHASRVTCMDAETGEIIWEFYANFDYIEHSPAYFDGKVYVNTTREVYCLDAQTGKQIYEKETYWSCNSSLSVSGGQIFLGTYEGFLCLDRETGEMQWRFKCDSSIHGTPATAYNKVFGAADRVLYCLDAENGEVIWKREIESPISTSLVVADGKVAFGAADGTLFIVNAKSGRICESLNLGDSPVEALALSNGKLIVGQENGRISCFEGSAHNELIPIILTCTIAIVLLVVILISHRRKKHTGGSFSQKFP